MGFPISFILSYLYVLRRYRSTLYNLYLGMNSLILLLYLDSYLSDLLVFFLKNRPPFSEFLKRLRVLIMPKVFQLPPTYISLTRGLRLPEMEYPLKLLTLFVRVGDSF